MSTIPRRAYMRDWQGTITQKTVVLARLDDDGLLASQLLERKAKGGCRVSFKEREAKRWCAQEPVRIPQCVLLGLDNLRATRPRQK